MLSAARVRAYAAERYLNVLAELAPACTLLDVRYRTSGRQLARFFIGMHARDRAALITRVGRRTDIYVGCAPRLRRSGGRNDVAPTALLWVDCDTPKATRALRSFAPEPSMIVASGTGEHGYWPLTETVTIEVLENANRRLAALLDADPKCADAARILRVPDTLNFKHDPPRPVELSRYTAVRYAPAEILNALPPLPTRPTPQGTRRPRQSEGDSDPLLLIEPAHYVRVLTGREPGRDGKIHCPIHDEKTPSFHVYPTPEQGWTCFGCPTPNGKPLGGDIYTLAGILWGIPTTGPSFIELRRRLDGLFGVHRE
jgi:hypothetical protein